MFVRDVQILHWCRKAEGAVHGWVQVGIRAESGMNWGWDRVDLSGNKFSFSDPYPPCPPWAYTTEIVGVCLRRHTGNQLGSKLKKTFTYLLLGISPPPPRGTGGIVQSPTATLHGSDAERAAG